MKCPECGKEVYDLHTCTNCGLVVDPMQYDFGPCKKMNGQKKEKEYDNEGMRPLDPSIQYTHIFPKRVRRPALRRAFKVQRKEQRESDAHEYMKTFLDIKKHCSVLQLPKIVIEEVLNIYRCTLEKEPNFFMRYGRVPSYMAFIKIACRIHDYIIKKSELNVLADYDLDNERKFNRPYMAILKMFKLIFPIPKNPNYIDYVCSILELPYSCAQKVRDIYKSLICVFKSGYIESYILALYYILYKKEYKLTFKLLGETFEVSEISIMNRRKELMKVMNNNAERI